MQLANSITLKAYRHTYIALLTTTLVKLDQSIITTRLTEQPEQFQALFGYLANQLDGS